MELEERENLEELLRQAREEYYICWNFFNNCNEDMIDIALYNLKVCEMKMKNLNCALRISEEYVGQW